MKDKLFNFPIKTFDPEKLYEELINSENGAVFILDSKEIKRYEGDPIVEMTMVTVTKVRSV